jgi:hypothetical protein
MSTVSTTTRQRIEAQGYLGLSDATLAEVGPWLRFSPAICMVWVAIATYYESVTALTVLIPFAALLFTTMVFDIALVLSFYLAPRHRENLHVWWQLFG